MANDKPIKKVLTLEEAQKVRWFNAAKRDLAKAEKRKKELEAEIREFLGDATVATDSKDNTLVKVMSHPGQNRVNMEVLETLFPEAYTATVSRTGYTYLR